MITCPQSLLKCPGRQPATQVTRVLPVPGQRMSVVRSVVAAPRPRVVAAPAPAPVPKQPSQVSTSSQQPSSFWASLQAALARKPALQDDIASMLARPFVAGPWESLASHPVITALPTAQPQVLAQLQELSDRMDKELTPAQAKYVVRILATITTHPAVYSALALVEDIWNNERVAAAESILDRVITADRVAWFVSVLDDTFTPERIRKAAQLLQIFATEDRVSQLMDVVDTVGKDEHAEIVKTWADAVAIALEQDLVVRVLNTLQTSLPHDRVLKSAAALDNLITASRVEAFGRVLDGVLTPERVDSAFSTFDDLNTPDRLARMGPALKALGDVGPARMSAIMSAASYFLSHPASSALFHLVDTVMEGDRAARWATGLEAAMTPARMAWLIDAQAGRVAKAVSDPTKVKVAEEAMLWGMVTTELLADEQALHHGLDMLSGVLLTPPHIRKFIATVDCLLQPRRAALWANAIEDILVPLLPPPMLLSHLQCYASCASLSSVSSVTSLASRDAGGVAAARDGTAPTAAADHASNGSSNGSSSGTTTAAATAAATSSSTNTHAATASGSQQHSSGTSSTQAAHSGSGFTGLPTLVNLEEVEAYMFAGTRAVRKVVSERKDFMGELAHSWLIPTALRVLDALLPIHRVRRLLRAMDVLLTSPQVLCEIRALVLYTHREAEAKEAAKKPPPPPTPIAAEAKAKKSAASKDSTPKKDSHVLSCGSGSAFCSAKGGCHTSAGSSIDDPLCSRRKRQAHAKAQDEARRSSSPGSKSGNDSPGSSSCSSMSSMEDEPNLATTLASSGNGGSSAASSVISAASKSSSSGQVASNQPDAASVGAASACGLSCPAAPVDRLTCEVMGPHSLLMRWARLLWRLHMQLAIELSVEREREHEHGRTVQL